MGSKVSTLDNTSVNTEESMVGKKHSLCCTKTSVLSQCYKSPSISSDLNLTPEYEVKPKRTRKCLIFNRKEKKDSVLTDVCPIKKSRISPQVCGSTSTLLETSINRNKLQTIKAANKDSYLTAFFKVFDDDVIQDFLWMDSCYRLSDKYLLSMVYTYFRRANLTKREYNRTNFFAALYLSHDMEEDNEDLKLEIFPWVLGEKWRTKHLSFLNQRDSLLQRMAFRAVVSKLTCDEVIELCPSHPIWMRERKMHHGGAHRIYDDEDDELVPRGPNASPLHCSLCEAANERSYSPAFSSGYLSACSVDLVSQSLDSKYDPDYSLQEVKGLMVVDEDSDEILLCREE